MARRFCFVNFKVDPLNIYIAFPRDTLKKNDTKLVVWKNKVKQLKVY